MHFFARLPALLAAGLWWLMSCAAAHSIDDARAALIDAHALAAPREAEASAELLVRYLTQVAQNDTEKARVIYRWIADRIDYDVDAYLGNRIGKQDAEQVLQSRVSVCNGFAALFEQLGKQAGLEVSSILGYAKGYGYPAGQAFDAPNHAWNAIKLDGQWRLIDPTWGAGYVKEGKYLKVLTEDYFLASPEQLAFSHLPLDQAWQLQSTPRLSKREFEALPTLQPAFFHTGIAGEDVWRTLHSANFSGALVRTFDTPYGLVKVQDTPLPYQLKADQAHHFQFQAAAFETMAVLLNGKWTELTRHGNQFDVSFTPNAQGELLVLGKRPDAVNYTAILAYRVE